ncbi:helicase HerA-like domain-containing protein [Roseixanthobacter liquoris]|uniref:helicase HerA-like domain-containing protein n=1 Tax=Roseixanthobacter liquoris TaxID=3119921 RepID=UPI00372C4DEF
MTPRSQPETQPTALEAFRAVDFESTRNLKSIWRDVPYEVSDLHADCLGEILTYFDKTTRDPEPSPEPRGYVVVGPAGHGKTHLIGRLRQKVWQRGGWFVLLDLVGVKDFWSSVALGFVNSLQVKRGDGMTQYDGLILKIAEHLGIADRVGALAASHQNGSGELMAELVKLFLKALGKSYPQETIRHRDVVTALILLTSDDLDQQSIAHSWLQGVPLDPQDLRSLGFKGSNAPILVVKGLSWLMSLVGPTLIGVDQIDAIVSAANARARAEESMQEAAETASIVEQLRQGLMDLYDVKCRAVVVVSCLEATWQILRDGSTVAVTHRFLDPLALPGLPHRAPAAALIAARLATAYREAGFAPLYPTWPFRPEAFVDATGLTPRELLRACERHQLKCVRDREVTELIRFGGAPEPVGSLPAELDALYAQARQAADVKGLLDESREEDLRALFAEALQHFERQLDLPDTVSGTVQFETIQKRPSLHGRLSFTFHAKGDVEHHYCFRVLAHANDRAFQSRIAAAITDSGISSGLAARHLFLLRASDPPQGPKSRQLTTEFLGAGGRFIRPVDDDLRAFLALRGLSGHPDFSQWLRQRKPLFDVPLFKAAGLCPPPFLVTPSPDPQPPVSHAPPAPETPSGPGPSGLPPAPQHRIILGHRVGGEGANEPVGLAAELLNRHVAAFAGSGSGKTVLLRRLVEEAALLGIPAIVLDVNNDLARMGVPWPVVPADFTKEDIEHAARYHEKADVVIWTPGVSSGNPLSLALLPDFSAIGEGRDSESEDERSQAVEMARATLEPYVVGGGQKAKLKQGVLAGALRRFALNGGQELKDFIALLSDLPDGISEISSAEKLAQAMADQLRAAVDTNPLLRSSGARLDPALLFHGPDPARTRISVVNLAGLATDAARQAFVNQLQMALFTWVKQNPSTTGRLYVLDEAQNFAPSQASTACKASTRSLAAQARKYGLGMVFATQLPRGIDSGIVSNCTTHIYGRMSAPVTIEATRELMAAKGGAADDLAKLERGVFYFSTEGLRRPVKIRTPLCLSWHPANPPTAAEVVKAARDCLARKG